MADEGRFRLWNPQWCNSTTDKCVRSDVHGKRPMVFEMSVNEASSAAAEIGTAANAALNGVATPVSLFIVSSSASDTDSGAGHVRAIHVIGISYDPADISAEFTIRPGATPKYSVEEIRLNGTTNVRSIRYYTRVMHAYSTEFGSGDADAAGNITVESPENTALITIDAASTESNSSGLIYVTDGYYGRWNRCYISPNDADWNEA